MTQAPGGRRHGQDRLREDTSGIKGHDGGMAPGPYRKSRRSHSWPYSGRRLIRAGVHERNDAGARPSRVPCRQAFHPGLAKPVFVRDHDVIETWGAACPSPAGRFDLGTRVPRQCQAGLDALFLWPALLRPHVRWPTARARTGSTRYAGTPPGGEPASYMKRPAAFRDQADDALHRQISAKADVLDFDDIPAKCLRGPTTPRVHGTALIPTYR